MDPILKKSKYTVLMFMAPDCPLSLTFAKPFNELAKEYREVQFLAVQSGDHYEPMEIKMFKEKSGLQAKIFMDRDYRVAHQFGATITPEFVLVDSSFQVLYQGLLDDRMERLGVYKQHWDEHYLRNALDNVINGDEVMIKKTDAVGCVLEYESD